tara:strand:+ start:6562 stop:6807 length:246 start_codon:yes stop_codon:yes gene_type:complete
MAYLLKVDGTIEQMGKNPPLEELQKAVGGYIEGVTTANGGRFYCNEEGKLMGLPHNPAANSMIDFDDYIVGDVVVMEGEEE